MAAKKTATRKVLDKPHSTSSPVLWGEKTLAWSNNFGAIADVPNCLKARLVKALAQVLQMRLTLAAENGQAPPLCQEIINQVLDELLHGKWLEQVLVEPPFSATGTAFIDNLGEILENRSKELIGRKNAKKFILPESLLAQGEEDFTLALRLTLLKALQELETSLLNLERLFRRRSLEPDSTGPTKLFHNFGNAAERLLKRVKEGKQRLAHLNYLGSKAQAVKLAAHLSRSSSQTLVAGDDGGSFSLDLLHTSAILKELGVEVGRLCQALSPLEEHKVSSTNLELLKILSLKLIGDDLTVSLALHSYTEKENTPALSLAGTSLLGSVLTITQAIKQFNHQSQNGTTTGANSRE
jgi:aspartate ammonia-lyase